MSDDDLLPCPFCGAIPKTELEGGYVPSVSCTTEDCVWMMDLNSPFLDDVVARWNTRITLRTHQELDRKVEDSSI